MSVKSVDAELALAYAAKFRAAGIPRFRSGTLEFDISPTVPRSEDDDDGREDDEPEHEPNAMDDAASFGRRDGTVPGFAKLRQKKTED